MLNDASVASACFYVRTCRRVRNSKKIATIRDFHLPGSFLCLSTRLKELTGVGPPFIPRDVISRAKWYFNNFNRAREKLVVEGKLPKNNPQYLYLIYKIFDIILDKDDKEKRRILHFIHLPAKSTLLKRMETCPYLLLCKIR